VDLVLGRWVFPVEESKGKNFPRIVYVTGRALEITRRLVLANPTGPLFLNDDGRPWNRHSVACAFGRLQVAAGLQKMRELGIEPEKLPRFKRAAYPDAEKRSAAKAEHENKIQERRKLLYKLARQNGKKLCAYHLRHSWATHAIRGGVDPLTVAILMGHADPSMLAKVYAHLAQDPDYLRQSAKRATEGLSPKEPAA
jgi:integrase